MGPVILFEKTEKGIGTITLKRPEAANALAFKEKCPPVFTGE